MKNVILGLFMLSSASVAAAAAESTTHVVALSRVETISGTKVKFDGTVTYTIPTGNCEPIPLELVVNLDDLDRNLLKIVKSAKVEKNKECGDRLSLSSAGLSHIAGRQRELAVRILDAAHIARPSIVLWPVVAIGEQFERAPARWADRAWLIADQVTPHVWSHHASSCAHM